MRKARRKKGKTNKNNNSLLIYQENILYICDGKIPHTVHVRED